MKDTKAFLTKDNRVLILAYQGSTVFFSLEDFDFDPHTIEIKSTIRDLQLNVVSDFNITKQTDSIDFELPHTVSANMASIPEFKSDMDIVMNHKNITTGKYYFDVEITENNRKYKLFSGILVLLPEYTGD